MKRFMRYFTSAAIVAVVSSSLIGCYTYIPAMSRESDGVYYNPSKDTDRQARQQYYAQNANDTYQDDGYYDDQGYDAYQGGGTTLVEKAYWSTMPEKYKEGGDVKIINTYYTNYDPYVPKVSLYLGYGFGGWYGSSWGFGLSFGNPYYPYWGWNDPWSWYGPWYRPGYWGWNDPWYGPGYWPGYRPGYWPGHHYPGYWPGGGGGNRPPAQRPPRRYPSDTSPSIDRRPSSGVGGGSTGGNNGGTREPSTRPSTGTSTSSQGYNRRPANTAPSYRVPGQSSPSTGGGSPSSSGSVRRSGYENIRGGGSSSGSSTRSYGNPGNSSSTRSYSPGNSSSSRSYNSSSSSYSGSSSSSSSSSGSSSSGSSSSSSSSGGTSSGGYGRR